VKQKLKQYPASSKIVVYRKSIAQTVEIEKTLRCLIYHYSVDDQTEKTRHIKDLIKRRS
jgi:hypothetical protein